jgi:hypothetical protein
VQRRRAEVGLAAALVAQASAAYENATLRQCRSQGRGRGQNGQARPNGQ